MNIQIYKNLGGNSNIQWFIIGDDYIDVKFGTGNPYRYSYRSAGREKVETMKELARKGEGLNSYINRYARKDYENPYFKLQLFRAMKEVARQGEIEISKFDDGWFKFIDETYHIENDSLHSLDILNFNIVPAYIMRNVDEIVRNL